MPFGWNRSWWSNRWKAKFVELAENGDWLADYSLDKRRVNDLNRLWDWDIERTPVEHIAHGALFHYHGQDGRARELFTRSPQHPLSQYILFYLEDWGSDSDDAHDDCLESLSKINPYVNFYGDPRIERGGKALSEGHRALENACRMSRHGVLGLAKGELLRSVRLAEQMQDPALDPDYVIETIMITCPSFWGNLDLMTRLIAVSPESEYMTRWQKRVFAH